MKYYAKLFLCLLLLSLVCLGGCDTSGDETGTEATLRELTVAEAYEAACEELRQANNLILSYTYSETRTVGGETFTQEITGADSLRNIGTDAMEAMVQQHLTYGSFTADYTELYHAGTAYALVHGSAFSAPMTADSFASRQLPRVVLTGALYGEITVTETEETKILTFLQPTAPEDWAVSAGDVTMLSAQGSATMDHSGSLLAYTYQLSYVQADVTHEITLEMDISAPKSLDLTATHPGYPEQSVALGCLDAPKMMLQTAGDIFTAQSISAEETQTVNSGALNSLRTYVSSYHITGQDTELTALATHKNTLNDYHLGTTTTSTQTDRYQNGVLSRITNDAAPVESAETPENIRIRWENSLLNCLFSLNYLSDAVLTETEDAYTLTFTGNDAYCSAIASSLSTILGSDLDSLAESHTTPGAGGYLTLSKITGLPTAMGMHFQRIHVLYGTAYQLSYQLDQTLLLASPDTAAAIAGAQ